MLSGLRSRTTYLNWLAIAASLFVFAVAVTVSKIALNVTGRRVDGHWRLGC
jgi:hypothetical protein